MSSCWLTDGVTTRIGKWCESLAPNSNEKTGNLAVDIGILACTRSLVLSIKNIAKMSDFILR